MIRKLKLFVVNCISIFGLVKLSFLVERILKKDNYIKVINLHSTEKIYFTNFLKSYKNIIKYFDIITPNLFISFLNGEFKPNRRSLLFTFDDGLESNYFFYTEILMKLKINAIYFLPLNLLGKLTSIENSIIPYGKKIMNKMQCLDLQSFGNFIGSHTLNHCRFTINIDNKKITSELIDSAKILKNDFSISEFAFAWVGGEINTYNRYANKVIKTIYNFSFNTIPTKTYYGNNRFNIGRTNIEIAMDYNEILFRLSILNELRYLIKKLYYIILLNE